MGFENRFQKLSKQTILRFESRDSLTRLGKAPAFKPRLSLI
jgi:hypothetical protein